LRSQKIAFYSAENEGHFGLAKDIYTHFTSPIRRYPDLVVHRALKSTLRGEKADLNSLELIARRCSELQRNAEAAERALIEWRIFRFLKGKLGDLFEGIVTGVARAGLVVELKNYFASGWIPADDLGQTFFFRKTEKKLVSRKTGKTIGLGDLVCVRLDAVDPLLRRMTLALCDS
jgi:ribonuclease R